MWSRSAGEADFSGDALREVVWAREKRVVPRVEVDDSGFSLDASTLHLPRDGEIFRAHEVRRGLVLPRDVAGGGGGGGGGLGGPAGPRLVGGGGGAVL